jgi:hypothetical protein
MRHPAQRFLARHASPAAAVAAVSVALLRSPSRDIPIIVAVLRIAGDPPPAAPIAAKAALDR